MFASDLERAYTTGKLTSKEFCGGLKQRFPKKISYPVFTRVWNDIFWPNGKMEKLVKSLKRRYRLYLISNTNDLHFKFIRKNFTVLDHFKMHFPSHRVGHRKPNPAIFKHALKQAKVKPEEAVFIDDIPKFVKSARKLGIRAIRFESRRQIERELVKLGVQIK